jgi:hypothetical protein
MSRAQAAMLRTLLATLALAAALLPARAQPIPLQDFFRLPQYGEMKISPDRRHIAALAPVTTGRTSPS